MRAEKPEPRRVGVLTSGRQDWGILRSTCAALRDDARFELCLLVGGMHLSEHFGHTVDLLEEDGLSPTASLSWLTDDTETDASSQAGQALRLVGEALRGHRPDALILVGDRFETAAAALAATLELVPIVHLHGGEDTEGAFDNTLRHSITKMSHLHLVSHEDHARRVRAMGEDPSTVHVVGAPGLDNLGRRDLADRAELETTLGMSLVPPVVVVTVHPTTLATDPAGEARAVVEAMTCVDATYVVTLPNTDPGHLAVRDALRGGCSGPRRHAVEALGERRYWGLLKVADVILGNSSSALIEAPVLELPAVDVGDRQKGRLHGKNVIHVPADAEAVSGGLKRALDPSFRPGLRGMVSPFGDGRSAARIMEILQRWRPPRPPTKRSPEARP